MISLLTRPRRDVAAGSGPSEAGEGATAMSPAAATPASVPPAPPPTAAAPTSTGVVPRACAKCGSPLQEHQDWCLQCGAGQPGSLSAGSGWRTGAAILAIAVLLVAGASVAAYAALTKHSPKPRRTVAARIPAAVAPGTIPSTPPATTTTTPPGTTTTPPGTPTTIKATPPKIPLQTPTPKASEPSDSTLFPPETGKAGKDEGQSQSGSGSTGSSGSGSGSGSGQGSEGSEGGGESASPILLDTNAASTYDPYNYAAAMFGDPSLAIDGEGTTAWTARVDPTKAPNMAEGLVLDLKSAQKLGHAVVKTTTTGTTVEVYGAKGQAPPASITDTTWKRLSGAKVLAKKSTTLELKTGGKGYRYVVLWLTKAPAGAASVAVDELELFPPK